ncbi:MAG: response regulator [Ferruginibacter sp.]
MLKKRNILLVENDPFQYNALKIFLSEKGYDVLENDTDEIIASYEDALSAIKSKVPDIAILDIELNGNKDGINLAEYLQPLNIPVIFLTSKDNFLNLERAKQLLPHGFIAKTEKPYDERNLWNALSMAMQYVNDRKKLLSKGISLKVREVELPISKSRNESMDDERLKIEKIFEWENIQYFYSGNGAPHNYTVIRTDYSTKKGFLYKASLNYFETITPAFFVRINNNYLINAYQISEHNLPHKVFMKKEVFELTKTYSKNAEQKIKMILGI